MGSHRVSIGLCCPTTFDYMCPTTWSTLSGPCNPTTWSTLPGPMLPNYLKPHAPNHRPHAPNHRPHAPNHRSRPRAQTPCSPLYHRQYSRASPGRWCVGKPESRGFEWCIQIEFYLNGHPLPPLPVSGPAMASLSRPRPCFYDITGGHSGRESGDGALESPQRDL